MGLAPHDGGWGRSYPAEGEPFVVDAAEDRATGSMGPKGTHGLKGR